ncbi:MAG: recombination protein RecR [Clostridia bacterium]|nr:recombination protein RecR [Clostridia bacterium]
MANEIEPIARLINEFSKLPGVGKKTAQRYAYSIVKGTDENAKNFADALLNVKKEVKFCEICGNYTDTSPCKICKTRKSDVICVVKEPKDVIAIDKSNGFNGTYHVLHGTINPMANIGPNDIRIKELLERIQTGSTKEVIVATNPDVEGEATAMYIAKLIKPFGIKVTRIAQGVAMGSELEFADEVTLSRAIADRREI